MARKVKIAVSLSPEVLELLDRHAEGRSRSRCVQEELLRALRAREWERLASQTTPEEFADQAEWAAGSFEIVDRELARQEETAQRQNDTPRKKPRKRGTGR